MIFKHRINFIIPEDMIWPELISGTEGELSEEEKAIRSNHSLVNFIIVPYVHFKSLGAEVEFSSKARPGYINVANARSISVRKRNPFAFLVVTRGDAHYPEVADFVIEHNDCREKADHSIYLPHPPQPGLMCRDTNRSSIEIIAFKGLRINVDPIFLTDEFSADLAKLGFALRIDDYDSLSTGEHHAVHDFHSVDISFAVRNLTFADALGKPANKLVNAWRAGTPAILGPEPGYQELKRSELDYFEVRCAADVLSCLSDLRKNPRLYEAMVENGRLRAENFSPEAIYGKWIEALNGPISDRYEAWMQTSKSKKMLFAARAALKGKKSHDDYLASVRGGPRILDTKIQ